MIVTLGTTPALQRTMTFANLHVDAVNRATEVREYASGKSINVARVIHTIGKTCVATGFLGGDSGAACRRDMDSAGIGHDFVTTSAKTRMCITVIDRGEATATELIEESAPITAADVKKLLSKLEGLLQHAKALVLSGTLAPGCGDDFYARCVELANVASVPAILDAKAGPLQHALGQKPFIVKPNRAELATTIGRSIESDAQLRDAIRKIISTGAIWVVVTNGPAETIVSDGKDFWRLTTPKVNAISPIGSGDAFAAGIAMGIVGDLSVPDACILGAACGAANAMTELAGHVEPDDVERLRAQVALQKSNPV